MKNWDEARNNGGKRIFSLSKKKNTKETSKTERRRGGRKRTRELKRSERGEGVITKRINQKTQFFKHANHL